MKESAPLVSFLMSVYKEDDELLRKSIDHCMGQSYTNIELILIDDGASEENLQVIRNYQDERIRYFKNAVNLGLTKSLNIGLQKANGKYIARIDSDDFSLKDRILKQVEFLESNQDYILCGTQYINITKDSKKLISEKFVHDHSKLVQRMLFGNPFAHSTLFFKKAEALKIGGYCEDYRFSQDYDFVYRMSKLGKIENLTDILVERSVAADNISLKNNKDQLLCALKIRYTILRESPFSLKGWMLFFKSGLRLALPLGLIKRRILRNL